MTTPADRRFEALLGYLKEHRGFDFTGYKRASLMRRVQRRIEALGLDDVEAYHDYLLVHPDEFTALFNTILINVTGFFRDAEAWTYLSREVLPGMLARRDGDPIRAWSAGCASGEEAYTLAMVLAETLGLEEFRERVKIYATDVDEEALVVARQASYNEREIQDVPAELRERYFEQHGQRFTFRKELRRSVIFGRNDLVQDAPISHVDVLACRNTLMYFNSEVQSQILQRLHFALRPDGILFLGKAEMLLSHANLFRALELKRRFFTRVPSDARVVRAVAPPLAPDGATAESLDLAQLRQSALMTSAAPQIVLDMEGRLALCNHRAGHLFGMDSRDVGRPIRDLQLSYRPLELRAHIDDSMNERRQVWVRDVPWVRTGGDTLMFDVQFVPLTDESGTQLGTSVIFNDVTHFRQLQTELEFANRQLETAYEELQSTNEELETTNEELQSTVEELETTNEELQSTNEELETMNEELQSMNDELHMVNEALRDRQDDVNRLNRFMTSVLAGMNTGVAVVDRNLRVMAWNAKAEDLWGVRADEALDEHLLSLDIGLPVDALGPLLSRQLAGDDKDHEVIRVDAVNRRGRPLQILATVTRLAQSDGDQPGAIVVMDVVESAGREPLSGPWPDA